VRVACSLGFENTYAFALRRAEAGKLGVRRLSDLPRPAARLRAASDYEFWGAEQWSDGLAGVVWSDSPRGA
jgi:glycine betaine/choline ABC-type transport system substrate-binding protein